MESTHNLDNLIEPKPEQSSQKEKLAKLVQEACGYAPGSPDRQRKLTQIITILSRSLWRETNPYYEDALQDTYCFLCRRLCDLYDPTKASVTTWINNHLKWRLHSLKIKGAKEDKKRAYVPMTSEEGPNPIDNIPAPASAEESITDFVRAWATDDADGSLRSKHLQKRSDVNCQMLILRRLPPEESTWSDLSKEFEVAVPSLSALYQRHCVPRLRKFVEELDIGD
jgi:hypothetical protein